MTPPNESAPRSHRWIWRTLLLAVWVVTAATLIYVLPIQPRLVLGKGTYYSLVGISADGELITLTERAVRSDPNDVWWSTAAGPIVLWDLQTGRSRSLSIPGQTDLGARVNCGNDGGLRMVESSEMVIDEFNLHIQGNWLFFYLEKFETGEQRIPMALDCGTGQFRTLRRLDEREEWASIDPSPQGRWYFENATNRDEINIWETATGRQQLNMPLQDQSGVPLQSWCISDDDQYLAYTAMEGDRTLTRVWNIETSELVFATDRELQGITLSSDHRLLAGYSFQTDENRHQVWHIVVLEIPTGDVVHQLDLLEPGEGYTNERQLRFAQNDRYLISHDAVSYTEPADPSAHAELRINLVWDLAHNKHTRYANLFEHPQQDPNRGPYFSPPGIPTHFGTSNEDGQWEIRELITGRKLTETSEDVETVVLSRDGRTMITETFRESSMFELVARLPIPAFMLMAIPPFTTQWSIVDVPSGQTLATLPEQFPSVWLSRDQKSLVTKSAEMSAPEIRVWDFPPRRPFARPLLWSLVVPVVLVAVPWIWSRLRRLRTREAA